MKMTLVLLSSLVSVASATAQCTAKSTIESWSEPLNEPCYVGGGSDSAVCVGYPLCCVKRGTCRTLVTPTMARRGAGVSYTAAYYDGGCWSKASSKNSTAPGCMGKQGECNAAYLEATNGATTAAGLMATVPTATKEAITQDTPCIHWNVISVAVTMSADRSDFCSSYGRCPGGQHNPVCKRIGEAAGMVSGPDLTWVDCTTVAGSTVMTATINLPDTLGAGTAMANLETNLGTATKASAYLSNNAHLQGYGGSQYAVTVTTDPVIVQTHRAGLSTTVLIIIIAGASVAALLILILLYCCLCKGKKTGARKGTETA